MLLNVADEQGFKIRELQHVLEGYKVAKEIAAHGVGGGTFIDWWGYKAEAYDAIPYNVALMNSAGVLTSVNSDSAELARHLNQDAAKAMKYGGLSEEEALKLCTLNGAKQLRLDHRIGSIEVGKDADLVIWTGHPLSTYSRVETTLVEGEILFDRQQDLAAARSDWRKEKKDRLKKEADDEAKNKKKPGKNDDDAKPEDDAMTTNAHSLSRCSLRPRRPRSRSPSSSTAPARSRRSPSATPRSFRSPRRRSPNGTIVFANGVITAVGANVAVPADATVIDGTGLFVYPGLIDAGSHVGLEEISSVPGTVDTAELGDINPNAHAEVAVNPHSDVDSGDARERHHQRRHRARGRHDLRASRR